VRELEASVTSRHRGKEIVVVFLTMLQVRGRCLGCSLVEW